MNRIDKAGWGMVLMWAPVGFLVASFAQMMSNPGAVFASDPLMWVLGTISFVAGTAIVLDAVRGTQSAERR